MFALTEWAERFFRFHFFSDTWEKGYPCPILNYFVLSTKNAVVLLLLTEVLLGLDPAFTHASKFL